MYDEQFQAEPDVIEIPAPDQEETQKEEEVSATPAEPPKEEEAAATPVESPKKEEEAASTPVTPKEESNDCSENDLIKFEEQE